MTAACSSSERWEGNALRGTAKLAIRGGDVVFCLFCAGLRRQSGVHF